MADALIQVPPDSTGKKVDTEELTVSGQTVERQRVQVAGTADVDIAPVSATNGLAVDVKALPNEGQQAMASSISVAVASDQSVLSVDDNAGSLTVDGTVTADAGTGFPSVATDAAQGVRHPQEGDGDGCDE